MRLLLTEEDFEKLVAGEIIEKEGVQIALQDIGFWRMHAAIQKAENKYKEKDDFINENKNENIFKDALVKKDYIAAAQKYISMAYDREDTSEIKKIIDNLKGKDKDDMESAIRGVTGTFG